MTRTKISDMELKRFIVRLIETWLPAVCFSVAFGAFFSMLAFLLQFTPLVRIAQILAWPGYLVNVISPIDDTPAMVQERILNVGIALILPVYAIIFLVAWFWFLRGLILRRPVRSAGDV